MLRRVLSVCDVSLPTKRLMIPVAGPSRIPATSISVPRLRPYSTISPFDRKGKGRDFGDAVAPVTLDFGRPRIHLSSNSNRQMKRSFHATARRDAIPLLPAVLGVVKSTTLLTAATMVARVLISFAPIGTFAVFKLRRQGSWFASERPEVSPEAEEFWKMWCESEKGTHPTLEQARKLLDGKRLADGVVEGTDGRIAYTTQKAPPGWGSPEKKQAIIDPTGADRYRNGRDRSRWLLAIIKHMYLYRPDLHPASLYSFNELTPTQQKEVDALRRYWMSLTAFKDHLRMHRIVAFALFILPFLLLTLVYAFGVERVPFTGRWRIILLTPEEEDQISQSLAGPNWYRSVINLLTTAEKPAPPVVPISDWRWQWVQGTLRRLEASALAECQNNPNPYGPPLVSIPKSHYPLKPRPRVSARLHTWIRKCHGDDTAERSEPSGQEHLEIGPPYNIMIMEKSENNAFSYGFGGKGAGGVVVYTGLLDKILHEHDVLVEETQAQTPSRGLFSGLFSSEATRSKQIQPTEAQTLHLACVLAHEMGHLLLSHHLETLSQQQVLWPSLLDLVVDLTRVFLWPFTIILGPTVNDALANVGKASAEGISQKYGHIGFQWKHEYEADLLGLRILALAGFDPHAALDHFSRSVADLHEIQPFDGEEDDTFTGKIFKTWTRATHPSAEQRTKAIREELDRWTREAGEG